jgi:hypothetical protein
MRILEFAVVMAIVYFITPVAFRTDITWVQSAAITLLAYLAKDLFAVEPEIYLINGKQEGEETE